jgi:uncharacterized membrane protein YdjX (TVP38/TMEM64 family)
MSKAVKESSNTNPENSNPAPGFHRLIPIGLIAVALIGIVASGGHEYFTYETLSEHREEILNWCDMNMFLAVVLFITTYTAVTALSIPGAIWITLAGGFIFGFTPAVIYVLFSATGGAILIFLAARYACADYFHAKAGPMLHRMEDGFKNNAMSYLLFLRLVPVFPFWLVNLVPALLGVPLRTFAIATFFGIIPGSIVISWVGSGLGEVFDRGEKPDLNIIFDPVILFPMIGLGLLSVAPVIIKRLKDHYQTKDVKNAQNHNS